MFLTQIFIYSKIYINNMNIQTNKNIEIPLNGIGPIGKIKDTKVIDDIISQMKDGYVACDFLNRTVGGVTSALVPEEEAQKRYDHDHSRWDASDEKLMKIYTKDDLLTQKSYLLTK